MWQSPCRCEPKDRGCKCSLSTCMASGFVSCCSFIGLAVLLAASVDISPGDYEQVHQSPLMCWRTLCTTSHDS